MNLAHARLPLFAVSLVLSASALAAPYVSKEGGFRVAFPSSPQVETQSVSSPGGPIAARVFSSVIPQGTFRVSYADTPTATGSAAAQQLQTTATGQVDAQGGRLLYKKAVALGKAPGIEVSYLFAAEQGAMFVATARDYLLGNRLFQVSVVVPQGSSQTAAQTQALLVPFSLTAP